MFGKTLPEKRKKLEMLVQVAKDLNADVLVVNTENARAFLGREIQNVEAQIITIQLKIMEMEAEFAKMENEG